MSELTVGREMDAAVAKALGWHTKASTWGDTAHDLLVDSNGLTLYLVAEWQPSTSDSKAFTALDEVMEKRIGWAFALECLDGHVWWAEFFPPIGTQCYSACRSTRAEAICRAILALAEATT
jgi:hypothetical protein